jgi:hypothetical protein
LWLFQVFALTAGLYGCQVWATSSLTYDSSKINPTHVLHLGFLKRLLGVKKGTDTHCVLRETGQMPFFFYWFRCIIRFWNCLLYSNNPLLEKVVRADLLIANRSDTWTYQFLHAPQVLFRLVSTELLEGDFALVPTPRGTLNWLKEPS